MCQAQATQSKPVKVAEITNFALKWRRTLKTYDDRDLAIPLRAPDILCRDGTDEIVRFLQFAVKMIKCTHKTLMVAGGKLRCWQVAVRRVSTNMVTDHGYTTRPQSGQMASVEYVPLANFAAEIYVRCDDVAMSDNDDRFLM